MNGPDEELFLRGPGMKPTKGAWDFGKVIYKRHLCYDPNAPGGQVACFCPIREDHDVAAFHNQPRVI